MPDDGRSITRNVFQVYSLQSVRALCIRKWCAHFEVAWIVFILSVHCFNMCMFTIFLWIYFSLYTLWRKISSWRCLVLRLISSQERGNRQILFDIKSVKQKLKNRQARNIFYLKSKLSFCFTIAWLTVGKLGIRKCNSVSSCVLIFGTVFYIYKLIHINLKRRY